MKIERKTNQSSYLFGHLTYLCMVAEVYCRTTYCIMAPMWLENYMKYHKIIAFKDSFSQ